MRESWANRRIATDSETVAYMDATQKKDRGKDMIGMLYTQEQAEEIKRLKAENAQLRERAEKAAAVLQAAVEVVAAERARDRAGHDPQRIAYNRAQAAWEALEQSVDAYTAQEGGA